MDEAGYKTLADFRGNAVPNVVDWQYLDLNYKTIASINSDTCIQCGLCHVVSEDTEHQAISKTKTGKGKRRYEVIDEECVGCNLCHLVWPVPECITMVEQDRGLPYLNWTQHPNNPEVQG